MYKRLLLATDISESSLEAAKCTQYLEFMGIEKVLLAQCMSELTAASMAYSYDDKVLKQELAEEKQILEDAGFSVQTEVITGSIHKEVDRLADKYDCDLTVVASHQHAFSEDILLGDIANNLMLHTKHPLLLLRLYKDKNGKGEECIGVSCRFQEHILFPTDFSDNADNAFEVLNNVAAGGVKKITLLHVQDQTKLVPQLEEKIAEFDEIDTERLENLKNLVKEKNPTVEINTIIKHGNPAKEILETIKTDDVSFLVMGKQGRGLIPELLLGGVSSKVVRHANVSTLLIPKF